jgi:hypothetical protein
LVDNSKNIYQINEPCLAEGQKYRQVIGVPLDHQWGLRWATGNRSPDTATFFGADGTSMGEIVNLRKVRKQLKKRDEAEQAAANRLLHGRPNAERKLETARTAKVDRYLDGHKIERGDA